MEYNLKNIAKEYAARYPKITNLESRKQKGAKIAAVLNDFVGNEIGNKTILDVGASGCVPLLEIIRTLKPKKSYGIDLDERVLPHSSGKLMTMVSDAMELPFPDSIIDIIICNHVYEHVNDSKALFSEMNRVLKKNGIIYFGAMNSRWPMEPHYNIVFLHWLPNFFSEWLIRKKGFQHGYLERPLTTPKLKLLVSQFELIDYTIPVISNPVKYHATDIVKDSWISSAVHEKLAILLYNFLPSYIWILRKKN